MKETKSKAILLAGGYGTRLKPLSLTLPKPMAPFLGKPILEHQIDLLKRHAILDVTVALLYQPEKIIRHFRDGSDFGVNIRYLRQDQDFGTAGSVRKLADELHRSFFVLNGDVISDVDLQALYRFHKEKKALATICLARVENPLPFGMAILDENRRIVRFIEKPGHAEVVSDLVNAGIYLLEPDILSYIPENKPYFFAMDLFPTLLRQGVPIYGFVHEGYWQDIGDLQVYLQSHRDLLSGKAHLVTADFHLNRLNADATSQIAASVRIQGTVIIGKSCEIGDKVRLANCVIGDRAKIGQAAEIVDSVIWSDVEIGAGSRIVGDVIADNTTVGENTYLDDNVFIGSGCRVGDGVTIKSNVKIWPKKEVETGAKVTNSLVWGDRWLHELFTGSQISGTVNQEVSPEFGAKVGSALGAYLRKDAQVLVGWDGSPAARMINRAIICGLLSAGVDVADLRVTPVPVLRYALQYGKYRGGVHVSLSSQKKDSLDILILRGDGQDLAANEAKTIERLFMQEDYPRVDLPEIGQLEFPVRVVEAYQEDFLRNLATREIGAARFKIVVDYSFGAASLILPSILGHFDCEVVALNAYVDTKHQPRSWSDFRYSLLQLGNIVVSLKADVGFLLDPSAERLFVVDDAGNYLKNEYLLVLFTKLFLQVFRHSAIGVPASAPMAVERIARQSGTRIVPVELDLRSISNTIQKEELSFIGDGSGRFLFPEFHFNSDGMFAMAKLLELLAMNRTTFSSLQEEIPPPILERKELPCPKRKMGRVLRELLETSQRQASPTTDGIKFHLDGGWLLLSPDPQRPTLHLIAEADTRARLDAILQEFSEQIQKSVAKIP